MRSNEEFIEGIYRKAEKARLHKTMPEASAFRSHKNRTEEKAEGVCGFLEQRLAASLRLSTAFGLAGVVGIVLLCGLLFSGKALQSPDKKTGEENVRVAQKNPATQEREPGQTDDLAEQETDRLQGAEFAQSDDPASEGDLEQEANRPQVLSEEGETGQTPALASNSGEDTSNSPRRRAVGLEETGIRVKLLRTEASEDGTVFYYEVLERIAGGQEPSAEFSLTLAEEEVAWFYPSGAVPGRMEVLWLCQVEDGFVLSRIEEETEE